MVAKIGRPSDFTQEKADEICARIADGETVRVICADDRMPAMPTLFRWLADERYAAFREQYTHAREVQAERMFEEMLEIADDGTSDMHTVVRRGKEVEEVDWEHINRSRLRVDTRKWILSKMLPKKYGDKATLEHTGKDGGPMQHAMTYFPPEPKTADEWVKQYGEMMGAPALPGPDATDEEEKK